MMKRYLPHLLAMACALAPTACEEFLEVGPPETELITPTVFSDDGTAASAMAGIYYQLSFTGFASGDLSSITYLASLSSDELQNYNVSSFGQEVQQFNTNTILPANNRNNGLWSQLYQCVYKTNALLEGVQASTGLTAGVAKHLEGEGKFIRAFSYFYLLNLYGDVPLVLTTAWEHNATIARTPATEVYGQIVSDLQDAQGLLPENYDAYNGERVRLNKFAATALLARVYLYREDWTQAAEQATAVIGQAGLYNLPDFNAVFLKDSEEAIWQLKRNNANTWEGGIFYLTGAPRNAALTTSFVNGFEDGDGRKDNWVGTITVNTDTYYFPKKYNARLPSPVVEYSMVLRLAEQYLIRAEARTHLGNLTEAIDDLDMIRSRAGLPRLQDTDPGITQAELLLALERERRSELFTEWGHRWLDLKRTGRADAVIGALKQTWTPTAVRYPIPVAQIQNDPAMANAQNEGY